MANPLVTPIVEARHAWGFLIWDDSDGIISRGEITIASGADVVIAGTVLACLNVGAAAAAALGANVGNGTMSAVTVGPTAIAGIYTVDFEDATHFIVSDPNGHEIGHGVAGTQLVVGGLTFTFTAGGTAMNAADSFKITVAAGSGKYVPFDPTGAGGNGSEVAAAIMGSERVDATSADQRAGALLRGPARVNSQELVWGANVTTTPQKTAALAQLAALGIQAS
jgi:hypothetical protein